MLLLRGAGLSLQCTLLVGMPTLLLQAVMMLMLLLHCPMLMLQHAATVQHLQSARAYNEAKSERARG